MKTPESLTVTERLSFANQYRMLMQTASDEGYKLHYQNLAEIFERGYTGLYHLAFDNVWDETTLTECHETTEIMQMFWQIDNAKEQLTPEEATELGIDKLTFTGFDGNNGGHYGYANFEAKQDGKWDTYGGSVPNSHSSLSIEIYRDMLPIYRDVIKEHGVLTKEALAKMVAIG